MRRAINSCYLDTNILLYLQDQDSPFCQQTQQMVGKLIKEGFSLIISPLVIDEYIYNTAISSNQDQIKRIKTIKLGLREILQLPRMKILNPPIEPKKQLKVLKLMEKFTLKPRDAYHLLIILENKIKYLATFDSDFESVFKKGQIKKFT